jgi:hypothetical protein
MQTETGLIYTSLYTMPEIVTFNPVNASFK